jgi:hypothetical protein
MKPSSFVAAILGAQAHRETRMPGRGYEDAREKHQTKLMYCAPGDRHGGTWRELAAAVSTAGGAPLALAAAKRAGAQ